MQNYAEFVDDDGVSSVRSNVAEIVSSEVTGETLRVTYRSKAGKMFTTEGEICRRKTDKRHIHFEADRMTTRSGYWRIKYPNQLFSRGNYTGGYSPFIGTITEIEVL